MVTLQVLVLSFPVRIRVAQLPPSTLHQSPILSTRVEAGACLGGEVAVSVDLCLWKLTSQGLDELLQRLSLLGCAGVLGVQAAVESSHVADAYGVGVVPGAVCPGAPEGPASADGAVEEYEVVVANAEEASLAVPAVHVVHGAGAPLGGRSAVYDDFSYLAHGVVGVFIVHGFRVMSAVVARMPSWLPCTSSQPVVPTNRQRRAWQSVLWLRCS